MWIINKKDLVFLEYKISCLRIMKTQAPDPDNANLFTVIERGDKRIRLAHRKAIILVGLTRIGKSTTFNWILRKPMKGKGKLMSHYINSVEGDQSAAKVGSTYSSVTLAPNVHVEYQKDVSLIDMAGYEDTRNYVGVIGVSYFLKALFEQVRQAKFVIVFDQNKFLQENGSGLIRTFNGFINMFHYNQMPTELKDKLKSSISVVITKSRREHEHFEFIDEVVGQLKHQALNIQNRDTVIELIEYVRNSARIHPFLAAKDSGNPEECNFIPIFSQHKGWKYFDLDEAQKIMGQSPISLPFNKDFNRLDENERNAFTNAIEKRVSSYLGFSEILEVVITTFRSNWSEFLNVWRTERKAIPNHFNMRPTFDKIKEFVEANDVYKSQQSIEIKFRVNYDPLTLVKSIKQILSIYQHVTKIGAPEGAEQFSEAMELFNTQFSALVECLRGFAANNQDEELLQRLKYILTRGFREFNKLYQLKEDCINDAKQKLRDNCNLAFEIDKETFIHKFVTEFDSDLLVNIFPTIELLQEYEQFFGEYEDNYNQSQSSTFFSEQRCNIEMAKADLLVNAGQKVKALHCYIRALRNLSEICVGVSQSDSYIQNYREAQLNKLSMKKLKLIRKIVTILKGLPQSEGFDYKKYALWLCLHHKMIEDTCQIYQSMIDSPSTTIIQRLRIYEDYAHFCAKWGRVERGIELLQKKLALEEQNFEDYSNTVLSMKNLMSSRESLYKEFSLALNDMKRLPEVDNELNEQLKEIEFLVQQ